jgi:hypothetical protein
MVKWKKKLVHFCMIATQVNICQNYRDQCQANGSLSVSAWFELLTASSNSIEHTRLHDLRLASNDKPRSNVVSKWSKLPIKNIFLLANLWQIISFDNNRCSIVMKENDLEQALHKTSEGQVRCHGLSVKEVDYSTSTELEPAGLLRPGTEKGLDG